MSDSESEKDFEKSCLWMNENFGGEEGRRKRRKDPVWRRQLNTHLLKAVGRGDSEKMNRWLNYGASVEAMYKHSGNTDVHIAASLEDVSILRKLLRLGASPKATNRRGQEPIHVAAWHGKAAAVTALCESDPTVVNSIVLLEEGAAPNSVNDPNACDGDELSEALIPLDLENGITSLHIASMRNFLGIAELLIDQGAKVEAFSAKTSSTPLDVVGIHAEAPRNTEEAFMSIYSLFLENELLMPKVVKRFGSGRCSKVQRITTALHTAVKSNYLVAIEDLLDKGACLGVWDEAGQTAIHLTIDLRRIEPLLTILKWNKKHQTLKVDVRNSSGLTSLHYAAYWGRVTYVMMLLQGGANASITALVKSESFDCFGNSFEFVYPPDECGCRNCSQDLAASRGVKKGLTLTACCCAVLGKSPECLQLLSADVNTLKFTLKNNMNLLHLAAWCNAPKIIKFLIDKFKEYDALTMVDHICQENIKGLNRFGMAPIHIASSHKEDTTEMIKCLVEEGKCDITLAAQFKDRIRNELHQSHAPLHFAARAASIENTELLYSYDKEALNRMYVKRDQDQLVFMVPDIAKLCNRDTIRELLLRGADLSSTFQDEYQKHRLVTLMKTFVDDHVDFLESIFDEHIYLGYCTEDKRESKPCVLNYRILAPGGKGEPQMNVLNALVSSEEIKLKESLLLHPLTETFIYLKWQKLEIFFTIYVFLQLLMVMLITALGCMKHVSEVQQYASETSVNFLKYALAFVTIFIIFLSPTTGTKKLNRYIVLPNFRTLSRVTMFVLSALMVLGNDNHQSGRGVASLAILLSWIELLYLLSKYPWSDRFPLGYHFIMFVAVLSNFAQLAASFLLLFVAFALSFLVLLSDYEDDGDQPNPYKSPVWSFLKTVTMLTDFDNHQLFKNDSYLHQAESEHFVNVGPLLGSMVYLGFFFLMCIAMTNFMTGVAIDDITVLKKQGKARQIFEKAQTIRRLERLFMSVGINVQVPLMKMVWLQDYINMNDLPSNLCIAVAERVKFIMKEKNKTKEDKEPKKDVEKINILEKKLELTRSTRVGSCLHTRSRCS